MARIRSIHPSACTSEKMAQLSPEAERCFWRLQTHCDDYGKAEDHPRLIWAALFPLHEEITSADVDQWLKEMESVGLIERYAVGDRRCLRIVRWDSFQKPQRKTDSKLPDPSASSHGDVCEPSAKEMEHVCTGEGEGGNVNNVARTRGTRIPEEFIVTPEMIEWVELECPRLNWRTHTQRFVNYWKATPGQKGVKLDWERTWQNWMLKEAE